MEGKPHDRRERWKAIVCLIIVVTLVVLGVLGLYLPEFSPLTIALCSVGMWLIGLGALAFAGFFILGLVLHTVVFPIESYKDKVKERIHQSLEPSTSLLRAGQAPSNPQEVLVRPVLAACDDDPQQLLRATNE